MPKNHPKVYTNPPNGGHGYSTEIERCLKRDRDIGRKALLSDVETAFMWTPSLKKENLCKLTVNLHS